MKTIGRLQKKNHDDQGLAQYCFCQSKAHGNMTECVLCREWFHLSCLRGTKAAAAAAKNNATGTNSTHSEVNQISGIREGGRYLCGYCARSQRPRLDVILSLLVSLQKLPVRLPEGEALQCLTERAMHWQVC